MKYFSSENWWVVVISALLCAIVMFVISFRFVQGYQLSSYKYKRFFKWIKDTKSKLFLRYFFMLFLGVLVALVANSAFYNLIGDFTGIITGCFAVIFTGMYVHAEKRTEKKTPLKVTNRIVRLYIVSIILFAAFGVFALYFIRIGHYLTTAFVFMTAFLAMPFIVILASLILYPFEKLNNYRYIVRARKKLKRNDCKVIAITGSFGKTSVKNILYKILSTKYKCVMSRDSYNTPMGVTKTILQDLKDDTQFLILEMGARQKGDIDYLCKISPPNVSVITAIGNQHLEYFKTVQNIESTKYEIIQSSTEAAFFGKTARELFQKASVKKFVYDEMTDYEVSSDGSSFIINGIKFTTKLLGMHNIENIALCLKICEYLGFKYDDCVDVVASIPQIEHRLQIVSGVGDIVIIDDSYSSNPEAAKAAFEVVDKFQGNKVVVTPGFIEQGDNIAAAHKQLAADIMKSFDKVILVGKNQTKVIYDTLIENEFQNDNIWVVNSLRAAKDKFKEVLQGKSVLLILNDLPDNFTESI